LIWFSSFEFDVDRTKAQATEIIADLDKVSAVLGKVEANVCLNDIMNTFITQQKAVDKMLQLFLRYNIDRSNLLKLVVLHLASDDAPDVVNRQIPLKVQQILIDCLSEQLTREETIVTQKMIQQQPRNHYTRDQLELLVNLNAKRFFVNIQESFLRKIFIYGFAIVICILIGILVSFLIPILEKIDYE
jgi:hypothetical protein